VTSLLDSETVLWRTASHVPFGVFVVRGEESRMGIEFRDGNLVTGLLLNETVESIDWAEERISRYRSDAERVRVSREVSGDRSVSVPVVTGIVCAPLSPTRMSSPYVHSYSDKHENRVTTE
jgi:hypothetical protein